MSVIYVTSLLGSHGPWKDPGGYKIKPPQVRWDVSGLCAMLVSVLEVESKNIDFCTDALDVLLFVCEKKITVKIYSIMYVKISLSKNYSIQIQVKKKTATRTGFLRWVYDSVQDIF